MMAVANYVLTTDLSKEWKEYIDNPDFNVLKDTYHINDLVDIIEDSDEIPSVIATAAWEDIRKLSCKELKTVIDSRTYGNYYIYQLQEGKQKDLLRLNDNVLVKNLGR